MYKVRPSKWYFSSLCSRLQPLSNFVVACQFQSIAFLLKWSDAWLGQSWLHGASLFPLCWAWRNRNTMCLGNENWSTARLSLNIHGMVHTLNSCYTTDTDAAPETISVKWNNANHSGVIINVDGTCLDSPTRAGYGGILRNNASVYLSGFSGYIPNSSDILYVELYAIYHGLLLAKDMSITNLVCYSDSLHCINIIKGTSLKFHIYAIWFKTLEI